LKSIQKTNLFVVPTLVGLVCKSYFNGYKLFLLKQVLQTHKAIFAILLILLLSPLRDICGEEKKPPLSMIAIDAAIVEMSESSTRDLGIEYSFNRDEEIAPNSIFEGMFVNFPFAGDLVQIPRFMDTTSGSELGFINRFPGLGINLTGLDTNRGVFEANFRTLLQTGKVEVISQPTAVSVEGERVEIETVDKVPFQDVKFDQGGNPKLETAFAQVGVKLFVTPSIFGEKRDKIKLTIHKLEVSSVSAYYIIKGVSRPVIAKSEAQSEIILNNKETLILGGLKAERERLSENKIPILGDIPVAGFLFKSQRMTKEKTDILFFITPYILMEGENPKFPPDFLHRTDEDLKI